MVAIEVQTKFWQLSKETNITPSPEPGSLCDDSLRFFKRFHRHSLI